MKSEGDLTTNLMKEGERNDERRLNVDRLLQQKRFERSVDTHDGNGFFDGIRC
jgi:hypothetical protein